MLKATACLSVHGHVVMWLQLLSSLVVVIYHTDSYNKLILCDVGPKVLLSMMNPRGKICWKGFSRHLYSTCPSGENGVQSCSGSDVSQLPLEEELQLHVNYSTCMSCFYFQVRDG